MPEEHQSLGIPEDVPRVSCVWTLNLAGTLCTKGNECSIIISKIKQIPFSLFPNIGWSF